MPKSRKKNKEKNKIVLAYSGGLDTSIILKWLQENYHSEVIAYTADIGQEMNKKKIIKNAKKLGVKNIIIEDLKNTFVKEYVYPMLRGHALHEGTHLIGTSIARLLIKDKLLLEKIAIVVTVLQVKKITRFELDIIILKNKSMP